MLIYLNYVILPVSNIGLSAFFTINPKYNLKVIPMESWVVFFTVVCFSRVMEFFMSLKKIIMDDARIYIETRKLQLAGTLDVNNVQSPLSNISRYDEKRRQNMAITELRNDEVGYMGRKRAYGEGEIRISKALYLSEDIYSMGFMSQIRDDIMTKYLDIQTGKLIENEEEVEHRLGDEDKDLEPTKENYKPLRGVNNGLQ